MLSTWLNDTLTQAAQPTLALICELDGLRYFNLGTERRPHLEQSVSKEGGKS